MILYSILLENKVKHNQFFKEHPFVAKKQFVNLDYILNLKKIAKRRNRGEAYKAVNGNSSIGNLFNIGRSGIKLVSDIRVSKGNSKVQHLSRNFLTNSHKFLELAS